MRVVILVDIPLLLTGLTFLLLLLLSSSWTLLLITLQLLWLLLSLVLLGAVRRVGTLAFYCREFVHTVVG